MGKGLSPFPQPLALTGEHSRGEGIEEAVGLLLWLPPHVLPFNLSVRYRYSDSGTSAPSSIREEPPSCFHGEGMGNGERQPGFRPPAGDKGTPSPVGENVQQAGGWRVPLAAVKPGPARPVPCTMADGDGSPGARSPGGRCC